ncbi:MAG: helicase-exonuclease AddAB subunit AddA [Lachnospiraceae bacterium]|nr:helicase-exonuclease AddAB subunit AddA [Lachnospiraceae bacterium]
MNFTPDQQRVIDTHHENILVAAAAGSGKTAVLVERIIQMICREDEPAEIDRLLVVTFTNAAAAEMRERIEKAIMEKLKETPDNVHLQRQATLIHHAQITTIDSFCLYLLRNHFQEIGLDPSFRVADEGEMKLLKQDILQELLEEHFAAGEESFLHLVECYCTGKKETELEEAVLDLYHYAMSYPWPEEWLRLHQSDDEVANADELAKSDIIKFGLNYFDKLFPELVDQLETALAMCREPDGPYVYDEVIEEAKNDLESCIGQHSFSALRDAATAVTFNRLPSKKDDAISPAKREMVKNLWDAVKKQHKAIVEKYFGLNEDGILRQCKAVAPVSRALLSLTIEFTEKIAAAKRSRNIIDFSDMEHLALQILCKKEGDQILPTDTALDYRDYFTEIMIDEYQDSNLVQEALVTSIAREDNLFMVGDVKQSIYRFRLARPELFMEKYHRFSTTAGPDRRIDLHQNFRSRAEVIDSVNEIFRQLMGEALGGIAYDDAAALYRGATYPDNPDPEELTTELLIREQAEDDRSKAAQEAELIAERIQGMIHGDLHVTDKETGQLRKVRYSDIVILLRSAASVAPEMKEVLEARGIPCYINASAGYFRTSEIRILMELLRIVDNPQQDLPLFGVLKSVFGKFTDEELAKIRSGAKPREKLYESLKSYDDEIALQQKCEAFLSWLSDLRAKKSYLPVSEFLSRLMNATHYIEYVSALPGGEQRRANVLMLLQKAAVFEQTSFHGLYHFVRYIDQLEKYEVDDGEASTLDENANVVRIMTIHKSKGLEFPVCFVSGLNRAIVNAKNSTGVIRTDMDLGVAMDQVDPRARVKYSTLRKEILQSKLKLDTMAEELRVLYVAFTRAKEKLIITGLVKDSAKFVTDMSQIGIYSEHLLPFSFLIASSTLLDWVGAAFARTTAFEEIRENFGLMSPQRLIPMHAKVRIDGPVSKAEQALKEAAQIVTDAGTFLRQIETTPVNAQAEEALRARMEYHYPNALLSSLYAKTTVSELKMAGMEKLLEHSLEEAGKPLFETEEIRPILPRFLQEKAQVTGTLRGSAMHRFMELVNLCGDVSRTGLTAQRAAFEAAGTLSHEFAQAVNLDQVEAFLGTKLASGMQLAEEAGTLHREQPFVMSIPANRLQADYPSKETVLVQGIIDVYYEDADGNLVLADYKTDRVERPEELIERYRVQMDYYAEALEKITGKQVVRKVLYSFRLGKEIDIV